MKEYMVTLNAECMCKDGNGFWFISNFFPLLCFYDLEREEVLKCIPILVKDSHGLAKFSSVHAVDNKIFLIPNNEDKIYIYQKTTGEIKEISVENPVPNMFRDSYVCDSYIYCIPYRYDKVVKLNIFTNEVFYIDLPDDLQNISDRCINSTCRKGEVIYCALWKTSKLLTIHLKEDKIKVTNLFKDTYNHSIAYICFISDFIYVLDDEMKKIYCIDTISDKINMSLDIEKTDMKIISVANNLILDEIYDGTWHVTDENLNEISLYKEKMIFPCEVTSWKWATYSYDGEYIWRLSVFGELIRINDAGKPDVRKMIKINRNIWDSVLAKFLKENNLIVKESQLYMLEDLLKQV